jgi:hypothetical protein
MDNPLYCPYAIRVTFDQPTRGYWNGGTRLGGAFTIGARPHPGPGHYIRWGCYSLNFWLTAGSGSSWKAAASYARRRLLAMVAPGTCVEVVEISDPQEV